MDAATISDTVNTAARIESLTKYYKSPLLLSGETLQQILPAGTQVADQDKYSLRNLGEVQLKGKNKLLSIYECLNGCTEKDFQRKIKSLPLFNEAMNFYFNQEFENSIHVFEEILEADPEDFTSTLFMENAFRYLKNGVPENWTGAEEMLTK